MAFGGTSSIVNPTLAGASERKTNVLDAWLLATHDLVGVWCESYLPSPDINKLRGLVWERDRYLMESTAASRRINNTLVRFGYTVGRDGSVAKNGIVRDIVEAILNEKSDLPGNLCPLGIPDNVREVIISEYQKYDRLREFSEYWRSKALAAYCGLDPSLKVSAKHVTSTCKRGGNKQLHKVLVSSADRLIRNHTEMFGRWGYHLHIQTGKWKKAANAVARKLAVAMYYMMLTRQPFSYENYQLMKDLPVLDIPVSEFPSIEPDFKRYIWILQEHDIHTTSQLATASCSLGSCRGFGKKSFSVLHIFLNEQHKYKRIYKELHFNHKTTKETINDEQKHSEQL